MSDKPDRISVHACRGLWVCPKSADIVFNIPGSAAMASSRELKSNKDVAKLIMKFESAGLDNLNISVDSVNFESTKSIFGGNSQAEIRIVLADVKLDDVPLCLNTYKKPGGVEVSRWSFGSLRKERLTLLQQVATDCHDYAETIAQSMGLGRGSLYSSSHIWKEPKEIKAYSLTQRVPRAKGMPGKADGNHRFPVQPRGRLSVSMQAEFRCGPAVEVIKSPEEEVIP